MLEDMQRRLAAYAPKEIEPADHPRAAVLIPLHLRNGALHVVVTKRSEQVGSHKGEISFPDGRMLPDDPDSAFTALRESDEEIGLLPGHVQLIGRVDDVITITKFHVAVFAGVVAQSHSPYDWQPQPGEVARIVEIPLDHLLEPANQVEVPRERDGRILLMPGFRYGDDLVWGSTARMLQNFLAVTCEIEPAEPTLL